MNENMEFYSKKEETVSARRRNTWFKIGDAYATAFFVPVLVMIIIFVQRGIFPFGSNSFLRTDMYHQFAPFLSDFQYKLLHGGSLLYSWDVGLGVNFSALYAYYLASPFNWLIVFCPKNYIIEFMTVWIVLKIGLCGLSMAYYLRHHSHKDNYFISFFAIFYALSAYIAAYSWCVMWLDCLVLFPLICLGLEKLVNEGKCFLYVITLGLSITSNYYISIMICMFMVIYFVALLILRNDLRPVKFWKALGKFAFYSVLAGALSAAVLLPEIFALQTTASGDFSFPKTFTSYFSIMDMLARHMGNIDCEIGLDHWPNIYCGVAVYILMLLYIGNRRISMKEKAVYISMLIFFLASFSINVMNYIWHGFHYPNSLPARQSFIYIFLVLYMCYRAADEYEGNSLKHLGIAFLSSFGFILLCQKFVDQKHFTFGVYYAAMGFVSLYALLLYLYRTRKISYNFLMFALLAVVSIESAVNTTITSVTTTSRTAYTDDNADVEKLTKSVTQEPFARFEKVTRKSKDDGAWMNFHSVSLFSSTASEDLSKFLRQIGCESSVNAYSITGSTPFADSFLDVQYALYTGEPDNDRLKFLGKSGRTFLYENPSTFPLAYVVPIDLNENWVIDQSNPADVQNDLCKLLGVSPVLIQLQGNTDKNRFSFTTDKDGQYYVFATNDKVTKVTAQLPEGNKVFENLDRRFFMELGELKGGNQLMLLGDEADQNLSAGVYRFDYDALEELKQKMATNPVKISKITDTHIEGTVSSDKLAMIMTSIPYDKGWTVRVDGQKVTSKKLLGAFMGIQITKGDHSLSMDYEPQGLRIGVLVSFLAILMLLVIALSGRILSEGRRLEGRLSADSGRKEMEEAAEAEAMEETEEAAAGEPTEERTGEPAGEPAGEPIGEPMEGPEEGPAEESAEEAGRDAERNPEAGGKRNPEAAWDTDERQNVKSRQNLKTDISVSDRETAGYSRGIRQTAQTADHGNTEKGENA